MSKETLVKYASLSQYNKKKCFALGGWCNRQGNIFSMQEVFDCLYEFANGDMKQLTKLIEQLTSQSKVFGRSSVVFGDGGASMYITRGEDGKLKIKGYNENFIPSPKGQHIAQEPQIVRKDGQTKKNIIKSRERLANLGQEVRSIYTGQSTEMITAAMKAIKEFAKIHKISEMMAVDRIKKDVYTLDTSNGLENAKIIPKMKTVKLNECQLNELAEATKLTEYKFYNNVQRFLSDLLKDPVGAKVPFLLQANNIVRNQLLYHLKSNGIINRHQKISDKDSQGNPKTARMIIKYSVPKKDFAKKMKKLFIDMVAKNVPEKIEKMINEDAPYSRFNDQLQLMKVSPLTMGVIGHPEYKQTDDYAKIINNDIDECDCGGAMGATAGNESMGQYSQPLFGVQRRKMPTEIDETTATTNTGNYQYTVPFGADEETADRTPGFSVERQDEDVINEMVDEYSDNDFISAATYIFAINEEGEKCVLAAKRRGNYSGGLYNVPVGMREEFDESIVDTAVREVQEETGLSLSPNILKFINGERWGQNAVGANFVANLEGKVSSFETEEGDGENERFSWIPLSEVNSVQWAYGMGNTVMKMSKL